MRVCKGLLALVLSIVAQAIGHCQGVDVTDADRLYRTAATAYQAQDWNKAARLLQQFVSRCPQDDRVIDMRFFLGEAWFQAGHVQSAHAAYDNFLSSLGGEAHASELTARFRLGETAYLLGDFQQAQRVLREFVDGYPDHEHVPYALPYLADLASRRCDYEEVIRLAQQMSTRSQVRNLDVEYLTAQAYGQLGDLDAALAICRQAALEPTLSETDLGFRFALLAAELDWQACPNATTVRAFQRVAASLAPAEHRCQALMRVAECCMVLGHTQEAIATLQAVLLEFPGADSAELAARQIVELQTQAPPMQALPQKGSVLVPSHHS